MGVLGKKMGRRLFSRGSLMAPVALASTTHTEPPGHHPARTVRPLGFGAESSPLAEAARENAYKSIRKFRRQDEARRTRSYYTRTLMGGLDADIACLQSLPYSTQVRMQVDRLIADESRYNGFVVQTAKFFGLDPDEFI